MGNVLGEHLNVEVGLGTGEYFFYYPLSIYFFFMAIVLHNNAFNLCVCAEMKSNVKVLAVGTGEPRLMKLCMSIPHTPSFLATLEI